MGDGRAGARQPKIGGRNGHRSPVTGRHNEHSSSFDHDDDDNDNDNDDDDDAAGCHPLVPIKALPKLFGTHLPDSLPFLLCPISCPVVPVGY